MQGTEAGFVARRRGLCRLCRLGVGLAALLLPGLSHAAPEMTPSADGAEVLTRGGLAWARCVEGMQWSGRACTGVPRALNHTEARNLAASRRQAEGLAWRVPRVQELQALFNKRSAAATGMDPVLFPGAPADWHWTSTTTLNTSAVNAYNYGNIRRGVTGANVNQISYLHGWAVSGENGELSGDFTKKSKLLLRLVRNVAEVVPAK